METMKVRCGTRNAESFVIDLDDYAKPVPTNADEKQWRKAFDMLFRVIDDTTFMDDGYRNDQAVNACIALHVMGYDASAWFESFCLEQQNHKDRWFQSDIGKFLEHVSRIAPYLSKWGPDGHETDAFYYSI